MDWTETQKAMFVYKKLCDRMEYSENRINGRDYSRGIGGLLYNKAVCSGFAMIYKEAMDRLGIECHYQNREGHHSWNIAKLDGKYRALELTWDTCNKGENGCGFYYFNRSRKFYLNEHHKTPELTIDGLPCIICKSDDGDISLSMINKNEYIRHKVFHREDGSCFMLIDKKTKAPQLKKFLIIKGTKKGIKIGKIYSENELKALSQEYDKAIANGLLSEERLKRKISNFNGYVGFVGRNHSIYYDNGIEKDRLNIIR